MLKYVILGGFLGAGKTTTMIGFAKYLKTKGVKAAILVNDLGNKDLVDSMFTKNSYDITAEIAGDCICYQTESLVKTLRKFRDTDKADIVLSDIPGCGIGAMDHVYSKLDMDYKGEFELCPFVAVADPLRLASIMPQKKDINLPEELNFLFDAQLKEADVIILNKIDLIDENEKQECREFLLENYPAAKVFLTSNVTGEGLEKACDYILNNVTELRNPDIGYGSADFIAAEEKLTWYDRTLILESASPFEAYSFIKDYINEVRDRLIKAKRNVPHLKIYAEGDSGIILKVSLTGIDYSIDTDLASEEKTLNLKLNINARAACEEELLNKIMEEALNYTTAMYALSKHIFFTKCFAMAK